MTSTFETDNNGSEQGWTQTKVARPCNGRVAQVHKTVPKCYVVTPTVTHVELWYLAVCADVSGAKPCRMHKHPKTSDLTSLLIRTKTKSSTPFFFCCQTLHASRVTRNKKAMISEISFLGEGGYDI